MRDKENEKERKVKRKREKQNFKIMEKREERERRRERDSGTKKSKNRKSIQRRGTEKGKYCRNNEIERNEDRENSSSKCKKFFSFYLLFSPIQVSQ